MGVAGEQHSRVARAGTLFGCSSRVIGLTRSPRETRRGLVLLKSVDTKHPIQGQPLSVFPFHASMCLPASSPHPHSPSVCLSLFVSVLNIYASVAESMGGTMGGVLQIFFSAGDAALSSSTAAVEKGGEAEGGGAAWCRAFVAGVDGVEFYGGAKAGMRTVLDAIVPAADVLRKKGPSGRLLLFCLGHVGR